MTENDVFIETSTRSYQLSELIVRDPKLSTLPLPLCEAVRNLSRYDRCARTTPMIATAHELATILIIDDDVVLARAFALALTANGYQVRTARTAEEGLEDIGRYRPDAIVLDFRMPLINGLGFLYRLRSREAHQRTPVVVVTGDSLLKDEVKAELQELGAEVRVKPIGVEDLLAVTRELLRNAQPHKPIH